MLKSIISPLCVLVSVGLWAESAQAQTTAKPSAKPGPAVPGAKAPEREGAATFKVETRLDKKEIKRSRAADAKRDEAIDELKKLIPKAPDSRKAEMIFRLAELYWEKSKYKYGLEMEDYEKAYTKWGDSGQKGNPPDMKSYLRESELIKQNALKLYEKVLAEYPRYERNDEVLFYLGYNEYEAGNHKKAVRHYVTLTKQFPKSRLVADAYLQLGEHFFNNNDVLKARKAYERSLTSDEARVYNYALYKLAWCDYNLQEYQSGIEKLKKVIKLSNKGGDQRSVQLKAEALGDLARFFSYEDEVDTAYAYFVKEGSEELAIRYTTRLGALFHDQGKWELEIKSYMLLLKKHPMNEKAPYLQASVVEAYSQMNDKAKVRRQVERLVDLYRPGTPWYKAQEARGQDGKAALEYAYDLTETKLRDLVTEYHRDAQKRKDIPTYQLARDIYAKYLDAFGSTPAAYEMRFFYAEVLWALQEWEAAAVQYNQVATADIKDKKAAKKYARIAAYNQILAYEKIMVTGQSSGDLKSGMRIVEKKSKGKSDAGQVTKIRLTGLKEGKSYVEQEIPEVEKKLSEACDLYFKIAEKDDPELPAIKFKAAYLYYKHNHFVEAAKRYFEIIDRWPSDPLSKKGAHLILDSLNVQKKWDELAHYAGKFHENPKLSRRDPKFAAEVQELLEGASYLSIQEAEQKAQALTEAEPKREALASAATRFMDFQKRFAKSDYADEALFSAELIYDKANELDRAIEAAQILKAEYKPLAFKDKKAATKRRGRRGRKAKATVAKAGAENNAQMIARRNDLLLASLMERIADFKEASKLYEAYYREYPSDAEAPNALFNAGLYAQGLGDREKALELFHEYVDVFKARPDAADVYWRTCQLYVADKAWSKAESCYGDFKKKYASASKERLYTSRYHQALALEKQGKRSAALKEFKWLVNEVSRLPQAVKDSDGARLAAAHAAFELLEPEFDTYKRMKVTLSRQSLIAKLKKAEDLACVDSDAAKCKSQGKYLNVLAYGNGEYGICALTRMGQVYRLVATSIREAPLPRRLNEEQREIYRAELDNVALGPEEKGISAFERSLSKAYELNIYNKCTLTAQENLKELNPNKFPELQKRAFMGADTFVEAGPVAMLEAPPEPKAEPEPKAGAKADVKAGASAAASAGSQAAQGKAPKAEASDKKVGN